MFGKRFGIFARGHTKIVTWNNIMATLLFFLIGGYISFETFS